MDAAVERVAKVREAVGPAVELMIEFHGRLSARAAIDMIRQLEPYRPAWCEEPVRPERLDLLAEVAGDSRARSPPASGLMTEADFHGCSSCAASTWCRWTSAIAAASLASKKIAAMAAVQRPARGAPLLDRAGGAGRRACTSTSARPTS